jgi:hypothetical protein
MIDPTWERGNYLGRVEVARYIPRRTLRLKLACDDRSSLRMNIGISGDPAATAAAHEFSPEAFNGWPLFGKANAGHVPMAGPGDSKPIEVGIDLTALLEKAGPGQEMKGRFFLRLGRAGGSEAVGELLECAIRSYDPEGRFVAESPVPIAAGKFGDSPLEIESDLSKLERGVSASLH